MSPKTEDPENERIRNRQNFETFKNKEVRALWVPVGVLAKKCTHYDLKNNCYMSKPVYTKFENDKKYLLLCLSPGFICFDFVNVFGGTFGPSLLKKLPKPHNNESMHNPQAV